MNERRLHPRKEFRTRIVFENEFGEPMFYVFSKDFSEGGLFLESDIPAKYGSMMLLCFVLPGSNEPIKVTGEVVRSSGLYEESPQSAMGIRFLGFPEEKLAAFQEFLDQ